MNRLFRWGILIALFVLIGSSFMAVRIIFMDQNEVEVPALIGFTAIEAANRLQDAGLAARIDKVDSDQPENIVISQVPSAGEKIEKNKIVVVRVSRGGMQSPIPDVRGMEFAAAAKALDAAGFKVGNVIRVTDPLKPAGTVIAQNPASPALVQNNRMVELLVSEGRTGQVENVLIPDVSGQTEELARQILQQSDLSVSRVMMVDSKQIPVGHVVRTEPRAGSRVPAGNALRLYVSKQPDPVTNVPIPGREQSGGTQTIETQPDVRTVPPNRPQTPQTPQTTATQQTRIPEIPQSGGGTAPEMPVWNPQSPGASNTPRTPNTPSTSTPAVTTPPATQQPTVTIPPAGGKTAKIRYQVPPLSRPLALKIEIADQSGTRVLRDQQARGGEYITMDTPFSGRATVTVHLGGEQVWQERYD